MSVDSLTRTSIQTGIAAAKINLYLHVLGRRANGYHELDSLVAFADVFDTLTMEPDNRLTLRLTGPGAVGLAADAADNLVLRAARRLGEAVGRQPRFAFTLDKHLPLASGIGGGSADAAAALRMLAKAWNIAGDDPRVMVVAAAVGADIPVCLRGTAAYFGGIGEIIDEAPGLPNCPLVLVNPGVPLSTAPVFKARMGPFSQAGRLADIPQDAIALANALAARRNDLTEAAIQLAPIVGQTLNMLAATADCLLSRMSGSGATCFGLYPTPAAATAAAAAIRQAQPGWWVHDGRLVTDCRKLSLL